MNEREPRYLDSRDIDIQSINQESEEHETDLRSYLLTLLNRRWLILTVLAVTVIGVAIYSFLQTPVYQSKVVVDMDAPSTLLFASDPSSQPVYWTSRESFISTEFRVLKSKSMAKRVAGRLNLSMQDLGGTPSKPGSKSDSDSSKSQTTTGDPSNLLLDMLSLSIIPNTNLCEITFTTPNPKLSMMLANAWAQEYLEQRLDSMREYTRRTEELLTDQVKFLQDEITQKEKVLHDYSLEKRIVKPDRTRSMTSDTLTEINSVLTEATRDRISAEVRYQALKSAMPDSIPEISSHPLLMGTRNQLSQMEILYNDKSKRYKPDYPEMVRLSSEIAQLRRKLETERTEVHQQVLAASLADYNEAVSKERAMQRQLEEGKRRSVEAGQKELNYDQLLMEIENKKQLLTLLLQRQNQTDVSAQAHLKKGDISARN